MTVVKEIYRKKGPNRQQIDTKGFSLDSGSIDPAE